MQLQLHDLLQDKKFWQGILLGCFILLAFSTISIFAAQNQTQAANEIIDQCPYSSTQAQVQINGADPWGDGKMITLGQSVLLGGFHNGTGRFAGDPINSYDKNAANVEFLVTDPTGQTQTLYPAYPIQFTPTLVGTYTFVGKTRVNYISTPTYYPESGCSDTGSFTVVAKNTQAVLAVNTRTTTLTVSPSPSATLVATPRPSPSPSASPSPTPSVSPSPSPSVSPSPTPGVGGPNPSPSPSPTISPTPSPSVSPSPSASPNNGNTQPECVSLSAQPTSGGAQLSVSFIGKGRDLDGIVRTFDFNFGDSSSQSIDTTNAETNRDTQQSTSHTYMRQGTYYASLRVKDNSGQSNEWSSTPESCKVKIEVQGSVLAAATPAQPYPSTPATTTTVLPKSGMSLGFAGTYISLAGAGLLLRWLAKKLKVIT